MHTHIHAHTQAHRILNCVMHLCILVCAELGVGQSSGMGVTGGGSQRRGHLGMRTSVYRGNLDCPCKNVCTLIKRTVIDW